jgi:phosphoenolpyruvate carboxylase
MFRFIQYIERQIVFLMRLKTFFHCKIIWRGSLRDIKEKADKKKEEDLLIFLENFNVRTVLTAHPTQFYPGQFLVLLMI